MLLGKYGDFCFVYRDYVCCVCWLIRWFWWDYVIEIWWDIKMLKWGFDEWNFVFWFGFWSIVLMRCLIFGVLVWK